MVGLINTAKPGPSGSGMINPPTIQNPLLRQVEAKVETSVGKGQNREDWLKVVVAGMRAGLANGPQGILASMKGRPDPVRDCAVGAVNLVLYLRQISRGTMPVRAIIPAATTLMLQALDFADSAGIAKIGKQELARATHIFTNTMFQAFGITSQMLNRAASDVQGLDPGKLEAMKSRFPQTEEGPQESEEEGKATQEEVNYRAGNSERRCELCTMFRPPSSCTAVQGEISPQGDCDLFKRKA